MNLARIAPPALRAAPNFGGKSCAGRAACCALSHFQDNAPGAPRRPQFWGEELCRARCLLRPLAFPRQCPRRSAPPPILGGRVLAAQATPASLLKKEGSASQRRGRLSTAQNSRSQISLPPKLGAGAVAWGRSSCKIRNYSLTLLTESRGRSSHQPPNARCHTPSQTLFSFPLKLHTKNSHQNIICNRSKSDVYYITTYTKGGDDFGE